MRISIETYHQKYSFRNRCNGCFNLQREIKKKKKIHFFFYVPRRLEMKACDYIGHDRLEIIEQEP